MKHLLGRTWDDPDVQDYVKTSLVPVVERDGKPVYEIAGKIITPEEVAGRIFGMIKSRFCCC